MRTAVTLFAAMRSVYPSRLESPVIEMTHSEHSYLLQLQSVSGRQNGKGNLPMVFRLQRFNKALSAAGDLLDRLPG